MSSQITKMLNYSLINMNLKLLLYVLLFFRPKISHLIFLLLKLSRYFQNIVIEGVAVVAFRRVGNVRETLDIRQSWL